MSKFKLTSNAVAASSILAAALMASSPVVSAGNKERCGDVVKAGKNSCAVKALGVACQGHAEKDNLPGAWIKVPVGTCGQIVSICTAKVERPEGISEKKMAKVCAKIAEQEDETVEGGRLVNKVGEPI